MSILLERNDRTATLTLNRPDKRNALSAELVRELGDGLRDLERDDSVRVIVLAAAGKVFSAGADLDALKQLRDATWADNTADSRLLSDLFQAIRRHPRPVVARVHGHAIAGGCGLVAACDLAVAARGAKFGFTEVRIGFVPAIVSALLARKMPEGVLREWMLTGQLYAAEEARDAGIVNQVVDGDLLDSAVLELAGRIANNTSARAVAQTKRLLADTHPGGSNGLRDFLIQQNAFARQSEDCKSGVEAFLGKKDPPWKR
jgi:methylglutaconyl-CoA hydratase